MKLRNLLVYLVIQLVFSKAGCKKSCHRKLTIKPNITIPFIDYIEYLRNEESEYCIFEFQTEGDYLLDMTVNYKAYIPVDIDCSVDYLHIGNDGNKIDQELMTSYKYCGDLISENIVSRYNYLWVVISSSQMPVQLDIEVTSRPKVSCNSSEFECSPTQCIPTSAQCDGTLDCYNGRDEFCVEYYKDNSCFYCFDGTCINPLLPRYHENWGKELWYLCDGFQHCPDGTDERKDICYRVDSRVGSMLYCKPMNSNSSQSVMMWNTVQCDGVKHCQDGSDESNVECTEMKMKDEVYRPVSVIIVICFAVFSIVGTLVALRVYKVQQNKRINNEPTQTEASDIQLESEKLTTAICEIDLDVPEPNVPKNRCESLNNKCDSLSEGTLSKDSLSLTSSNPGTLKSYQEVGQSPVCFDDNVVVIEYMDEKGVRYSDI